MYYTISPTTVHEHAAQLLQTCLRLRDFSPDCTVRVLLHVIFTACSRLCSLSAACFSLATAPSRETIRKATLRALRRCAQQVSIDLVLIPYHGEPLQDITEIYRSQAKSGTTHFHAYATAYVNYR